MRQILKRWLIVCVMILGLLNITSCSTTPGQSLKLMELQGFICELTGGEWVMSYDVSIRGYCDRDKNMQEDANKELEELKAVLEEKDLDKELDTELEQEDSGLEIQSEPEVKITEEYVYETEDPSECFTLVGVEVSSAEIKDTDFETWCKYYVKFENPYDEPVRAYYHIRKKTFDDPEPQDIWHGFVHLAPRQVYTRMFETLLYKKEEKLRMEVLLGLAMAKASKACDNTFANNDEAKESIYIPFERPCQ